MSQPPPSAQERQAQARRRAEVIVQVRSGLLTAKEAAAQLGVSRKTYYKWERRALAAMIQALHAHSGGRPPSPNDPEKETLRQQNQQLQEKLTVLEESIEIRRLWDSPDKKKG